MPGRRPHTDARDCLCLPVCDPARAAGLDTVHDSGLVGSQLSLDFITMTALATLLATLGLLLSSPAVIIGAMLVAPVITAMLGLGLAVVEGEGGNGGGDEPYQPQPARFRRAAGVRHRWRLCYV